MATASEAFGNHYFIPLSESKAREWVAALPLTDLGETTRRVFHGLVNLNRHTLPANTRLAISEMLRPATELALENLRRHLEAPSFPLSPKGQKIFELGQALMLEFAGSYQIAALDMITKKEGNKKSLQLAAYRALDMMGRVLLFSYALYMRTHENLWRDIHHLYLLAVENGVDELKMRDHAPGAPTIASRYLQMNLLALAKPYSLRQGEAERLAHYFAQHTHLVSLGMELPEQHLGEYVHAAVLNSDEPAVMMPVRELPHSPTVRTIALAPLVAHLDSQIRAAESKGAVLAMLQDGLIRNLAKRVVYHLTTLRNRSFNRFPKNETIGMVTRLPEVLAVVQHAQKQAEANPDHEAEDFLFNVFANHAEDDEATRQLAAAQQRSAIEARIQIWRVLNTSVGGYGLCWAEKETSGARVGEIVGLRNVADIHSSWMVGVIKWMEFASGKGLCCGVELLSTKAMVFSVKQVTNRKLTAKLPLDGLMLPSIEGAHPDPALILPAYLFQVGDELRLTFAEREERVRLVLLDECLGVFAYFRFTSLAQKPQAIEEEEDYAALWQSL